MQPVFLDLLTDVMAIIKFLMVLRDRSRHHDPGSCSDNDWCRPFGLVELICFVPNIPPCLLLCHTTATSGDKKVKSNVKVFLTSGKFN